MTHWWRNSRGYIEGRVILADGSSRRVRQHRWIMEQHLGRALVPGEIVHHKNGKRNDNRLANLEVMTGRDHARHHYPEKRGKLIAAQPEASAALVAHNRKHGPWNKAGPMYADYPCAICGAVVTRKRKDQEKGFRRGYNVTCSPKCRGINRKQLNRKDS